MSPRPSPADTAAQALTITTWNVNSIRKRLESVLAWMEKNRPDVVCFQETKCTEDRFPWVGFASLGYRVSVVGQKAYNGVAIASRVSQSDVGINPVLPRNPDARSIAATIGPVHLLNVYVPHGDAPGGPRYDDKLKWFERLRKLIGSASPRPHVVCGDFNVAPEDRDVYDPDARREKLISSTPERRAFRRLLDAGYVDAFREQTLASGHYTWWSHRIGAVAANKGLRVDHHLVDVGLRRRIHDVRIDRGERERPGSSDHAPVTLSLEVPASAG
jgi:exodeoxyribonuclease-3